jgi:hypothetical protein
MSNKGTVDFAVTLALRLITALSEVSAVISQAKAEGRDDLTEADLIRLRVADDGARAQQVEAIERARNA